MEMKQERRERREKRNAYYRDRRAYLKSRYRCVYCGKQDDRTTAGKSSCSACAEWRNAYMKRYMGEIHPELKERMNAMARARRAERSAAGVCITCGKRDARTEAGRVLCEECNRAQVERNKRYLARKAANADD